MPKPEKPEITGPSRNLNTAHFAEIGRVVVYWSHLETLIEVAIWSMLGISTGQGAALTTPLRYRQRMEVLRSLARQFFEDDSLLTKFKDTLNEIDNAYAERNKIDHAIWWSWGDIGPKDAPALRVRLTAKALPTPLVDQLTEKEIRQISADIERLMFALNDFLEAHTLPPFSSRERSWPRPQSAARI